ncbi:protoporphyrinogen oxidase [Natronomonas salina]|uniref:protoporphyrinogen oxidase n=1 Tax=Natronomonas salina TaxID=1710540 RepID=UPI0015B50677|nr:protoporphyrinogen oxidase [Natronomonas salina]QLD89579.1 protoporphyrinogen oxidase [Natronomonas salina]
MTVGIVGAGITGLAVTHYLSERDVDVVTFEAAAEPGGVIESRRADDHVLEYGPQRIRLVSQLEALIDDLNLREEMLVADEDLPLYVYAEERLREVPRSLRGFLETDLLSWRGKLRLLAEPLTSNASTDERAATLFQRKFGHEAYHNVIEPLFGGIFGSDPSEMPAEYSLSRLVAMEERRGSLLRVAVDRLLGDGDVPPPVSFTDGLQSLPEAIYDAHRPYVHLDTTVEAVRADGDGYRLETGGSNARVDELVVTVPAADAASLLVDLESASPGPLRDLTYNPLALVFLKASVDRQGFGYQVRRDEPLRTLGVTWNASLFDRVGVHTAFLGGMDDPEAVELPAEELGAIASREFQDVLGVEPSVIDVRKMPRAFPAYDTSWAALDEVSLPTDVHLATNYTGRMGVTARLREAERLATRLAGSETGTTVTPETA